MRQFNAQWPKLAQLYNLVQDSRMRFLDLDTCRIALSRGSQHLPKSTEYAPISTKTALKMV